MGNSTARLAKNSWKLKDLIDGEVAIPEWSLETPRVHYMASSASYARQAGGAMIHFAQVIGETPMNALAVAIPPSSVRNLLSHLGQVRERIERLEREGLIEAVPMVSLERLVELKPENYVQKAADRVRVATNDEFSSLDFYKMPVIPRALIEAHPNVDLDVDGVVRVVMPASLFRALIAQMEEVEAYDRSNDAADQDDD